MEKTLTALEKTSNALYYCNKGKDVSEEETRRDFPARMEIKAFRGSSPGRWWKESPVEETFPIHLSISVK